MSNKKQQAVNQHGPIQFNWKRDWAKKVAPCLHTELVQSCLDMGMTMLDKSWKRGDAPHSLGRIGKKSPVEGKLSWYQPLGRSHWIVFFSMAIGVINYPDLDWRFVTGDAHTVAVGYGADGKPRVVMDILQFDRFTAEQSLEHTQVKLPKMKEKDRKIWAAGYRMFEGMIIPKLKEAAKHKQSLTLALPGHPFPQV